MGHLTRRSFVCGATLGPVVTLTDGFRRPGPAGAAAHLDTAANRGRQAADRFTQYHNQAATRLGTRCWSLLEASTGRLG
jgi:hypothetical protein